MSTRALAAIGIWRSRNARTHGDGAFLIYSIFMVGLIAIVPVARAVWLSAIGTSGFAAFASPAAPGATVFAAAALWAGALLLGRDRGPALLPPFLTHSLATSDLTRSDVFRAPVLRAGTLVTAVTTIAAGLVGSSLANHGLADPLGVLIFTVVGALVGVISTVAWLAGQAFPRAAIPIALSILALGAVTAIVPVLHAFTPWGWVGLAYPASGAVLPLVSMIALTIALVAAAPVLINRLTVVELAAQAARWDSATTLVTGMDFGAAATIYQGRPHFGRRIRAVRPRSHLALTFLIRDALGATRTPGRLVIGSLALILAGALLGLALVPATPSWLLGAAAGVIVFAGLGPLTDGIRHAVSVASDLPIYGISDARLLANHALFPLTLVVVVVIAAAIVCAMITGTAPGAAAISSVALGLLALVTRINNALKGPLPLILFTPMSTPAGDPMAAVRMAWALDGVLLAALGGASAALAFESPLLLFGVGTSLVGIGIHRWNHRK